jgi:hypothetical protein
MGRSLVVPATPPPSVAPDDTLGGRIRRARLAWRMSQAEFARRIGISQSSVSLWRLTRERCWRNTSSPLPAC